MKTIIKLAAFVIAILAYNLNGMNVGLKESAIALTFTMQDLFDKPELTKEYLAKGKSPASTSLSYSYGEIFKDQALLKDFIKKYPVIFIRNSGKDKFIIQLPPRTSDKHRRIPFLDPNYFITKPVEHGKETFFGAREQYPHTVTFNASHAGSMFDIAFDPATKKWTESFKSLLVKEESKEADKKTDADMSAAH